MKKGLFWSAFVYSMMMSGGIILASLIDYYLFPFTNVPLFKFLMIVSTLTIFVLLGIHMNKKHKESNSYGKFIFVGILSTIISSLIYVCFLLFFGVYIISGSHELSYWILNFKEVSFMFLSNFGIIITECLIIGIFYKKLKLQKR